METPEKLAEAYLKHLAAGDMDGVMALFAPDAVVHSPLYGSLPARAFYPRLARDTAASQLEFRELFLSASRPDSFALRFTYHWRLANGGQKSFDCVDVFVRDEHGLILELTIIYDTWPRL